MKRGSDTSGSAAATAGLNRSVCPVATSVPRRSAAASSASASASDEASGFSTSTGTPASTKGSAIATCDTVGVAMLTAFTRPRRADASVSAVVP
jgi:hypothetical protein